MQTPEGQKKAIATMKAKYPDHFQKIGALGGKAKVPKGFARMSKEKHRQASIKGGQGYRTTK